MGTRVEVPWATVAAGLGLPLRSRMRFHELVGLPIDEFLNGLDEPNDVWTHPPAQGTLPRTLASRLRDVLADYTTTTVATVGVWSGWAFMAVHRRTVPTATAFGREQLLFRAPLNTLDASVDDWDYHCANLWLAVDRRWVVTTDIDSWSTLVGSSEEAARKLSVDDRFEVRPV
jgi:hypothetical protein